MILAGFSIGRPEFRAIRRGEKVGMRVGISAEQKNKFIKNSHLIWHSSPVRSAIFFSV